MLQMNDSAIQLTCAVCKEFYQDPRVTPCGHTFCCQCIRHSTTCYVCKRPVTGDATRFSKNAVMKSLVSSLPSITTCALSLDNRHGRVEFICINCWDPLCVRCGYGHTLFSRQTADHEVKKLSDINSLDVAKHNKQKASFCVLHTEQQVYLYCKQCEETCCALCYALKHNKHDCVSIEEADEKFIKTVEVIRQRLAQQVEQYKTRERKRIESCKSLDANREGLLSSIKIESEKVKKKMKDEFDKIMKLVDDGCQRTELLVRQKVESRAREVEQGAKEDGETLQKLQAALSITEEQLPPLSSVYARVHFVKDGLDLVNKLPIMRDNNDVATDICQLPDIEKLKFNLDKQLEIVTKTTQKLHKVAAINGKVSRPYTQRKRKTQHNLLVKSIMNSQSALSIRPTLGGQSPVISSLSAKTDGSAAKQKGRSVTKLNNADTKPTASSVTKRTGGNVTRLTNDKKAQLRRHLNISMSINLAEMSNPQADNCKSNST